MKIIELRFRNINNLKGDHCISFNKVPLSTASIFAIVGPTGSGKSTILDVITLALFNRIPRFSKPLSKNEITKEASVLTHNTKDAAASIEYEIKGKRYKSAWVIRTNRNEKLNDYEMTFYNADGSVEDLKKSEVPAKNEQIIGLKYDQFVKAILLSQGEFSKFLKANKNERGALLENLTGTSVYRKIGVKAFEKYKEVKNELDKENALLGENTVLDNENRELLENELKTSKNAKITLDNELEALNKLLNIKKEKQNLQKALQNKEKEFTTIQSEERSFEPHKLKLDTHHKLSPLQGRFTTYTNSLKNAETSRVNLEGYKNDRTYSEQQLISIINEMATLTKQSVNKEDFKQVMSAFEAEVIDLDKDLEHVKKNGGEARTRIDSNKASYPIQLSSKAGESLKLLAERANLLKETIAKTNLNTTSSLPELRSLLMEEQEKLEKLKVLENHIKNIEALKKIITQEVEKLGAYTNDIEKITPLIAKITRLIEQSKEKVGLLRKQKEDALKIAELEDFRKSLEKGEACPLCGSLEHPYSEGLPKQENAIDQKIGDTEKELKAFQDELLANKSKLGEKTNAVTLTSNLITDAKFKLAEEQKYYENQSVNLKIKIDNNLQAITQHIATKTAQLKNKSQAVEAFAELELNKKLVTEYTELQQIGIQYRNLEALRKAKFTGQNVVVITNKLQDDFQKFDSNINQLNAVIERESKSLKRDEDLVISITKELEPRVTVLGFSNLNEIASNLLNESNLSTLTQKEKILNSNKVRIHTEIENLKKNLLEKENSDTNKLLELEALKTTILQKKETADQHHSKAISNQEKITRDDADRAKIKEREQTIHKLTQEFSKWSLLNNMIGDATGNKFANFAQGLTLQNLLVYANRRLTNLTDRYLLNKPNDEGSLIVIDKYQGDSPRSVKTLSGGETFLISLALALSLSDMASKSVALGCLFIDEGFGTLDPDTLELAMTTLETLQSDSQKTVGIISHVEALKERINIQIKLNKNTQGYSKIEID